MNYKKTTIIFSTLITIFMLSTVLTGCRTEKGRISIPDGALTIPGQGEEAPDDIISSPGGSVYRANVHEAGKENPWEPITITETELHRGSETILLQYRNHIITTAGETRNNILNLRKDGGFFDTNPEDVQLYLSGNSSGLKLFQTGAGGLIGTVVKIVQIEIPPDIEPGMYEIEIGLEISGKDYGTVPCTVEVVEITIEE